MIAPVKIACIQMSAEFGNKDANLKKAEQHILEACENGANLLVLPENFNGSFEHTRQAAYAYAEPIPSGETSRMLIRLAEEKGVYVCGSFVEQDGIKLYNTSILVGPEGYIGKFRKLHLCGPEQYMYEPGDLGIPVFHTKLGRIALLICLDSYNPETFRIATLQGADIICVSYNAGDYHDVWNMPEGVHTAMPWLCLANAMSNHVFVVGCNRVGAYPGYTSAGQSVIASQWGMPVVPIAPHDREAILYAEVDLSEARKVHISDTDSRTKNRRTDVYDAMLGYDPAKYPKQQ